MVVVVLLTLIVKGGKVLRYTDGSLFFVFAFIFAMATMSLCRLIASFFSRTRLGAIAGGIIYFLAYLPYLFIEQNDQATAGTRSGACFLSTTCFGLGMDIISIREQELTGVTWSNANESPFLEVDFSFTRCIGMVGVVCGVGSRCCVAVAVTLMGVRLVDWFRWDGAPCPLCVPGWFFDSQPFCFVLRPVPQPPISLS